MLNFDNEKLMKYSKMVELQNKTLNLTAEDNAENFYNKHVLDSLTAESFITENASVCDIGSGNGCPALPLAIVRSDVRFTLVDSVGKKCEFLQVAAKELGLSVEVKNCRIEEMKSQFESFDAVTARAVAPTPTLLEYACPLLKKGGLLIAFKTKTEQNAENVCKLLNMELTQCKDICLFEGDNRQLRIYKKIGDTPKGYPRGNNKPRKNPL